MGQHSRSDAGVHYPLWIIAFSLLVIALCLLWDVVRKESLPPDPPADPVTVAEVPAPAIRSPRVTAPSSRPPRPVERRSAEKKDDPAAVTPTSDTAPVENMVPVAATQSPPDVAQPGYPLGDLSGTVSGGEIAGRVVLRGKPPVEKELDLGGDPVCSREKLHPLKTQFYIVDPEGGLADVVVFIRQGLPATQFPKSTNRLELGFADCQIRPSVAAVMVGQGVQYRNSDGRMHRVRIDPRNKRRSFDLRPGEALRVGFADPELFVPVQCQTHPWETAFVSVFNHPYFAVSDSQGRFSIPNVPAGNYLLQIVHQKATGTNLVLNAIAVQAGKRTETTLILDVPREDSVLSRRGDK